MAGGGADGAGRDGLDGRWGVVLVDVGRWVGIEIVAPTGRRIWDRTEVAM